MNEEAARLSEAAFEAYRRGDLPAGIAHLERALQLHATDAHLWNLLGEMYVEQDQFDAAATAFQRAISLRPELASAYSGLGRSLHEIAKWDEAEAALARSIELKPSAARFVLLADTQTAQGRHDHAEATLRRALDHYTDSEELLFNLGSIVAWRDPAEAAGLFRRAIDANGEFAPAYRELGLLAARAGRTDEAESLLNTSVHYDPEDPWPHLYLGALFSELGRLDEAQGAYHAAIAAAPTWAEPYRLLGELYLDRESLVEAVQAFQRAIATDSADADAAYGLGRALLRIGDHIEGRHWLEAALRLGLTEAKGAVAQRLLAWE